MLGDLGFGMQGDPIQVEVEARAAAQTMPVTGKVQTERQLQAFLRAQARRGARALGLAKPAAPTALPIMASRRTALPAAAAPPSRRAGLAPPPCVKGTGSRAFYSPVP